MKKAKYIFLFLTTVLFLLFIGLYLTQAFGYYEFESGRKSTLTENAIRRFERDVKAGKEINVKDYLEEEKNYNNSLSTASIKVSNLLERGFNLFMNGLFNEVNKLTQS